MFHLAERRWRRPPSPPPLSTLRRRGSRSSKRIRVKRRAYTRRLTAVATLLLFLGVALFITRRQSQSFVTILSNSVHPSNASNTTTTTIEHHKQVESRNATHTTQPVHHKHTPGAATPNARAEGPLPPQRSFSVRCFQSRSSGASICTHRPVCAGAGGLISLATARNRGAERYTEENGDMPIVLRQDASYLLGRRIHWWEGGHVLLHAGPKAGSIVQFARRVIAAHHLVVHRERYGLPRLHTVVVIAAPAVLRRLRYSRSWHRALLDALAYPLRPDLRRRAALRFAGRAVPPPYPRVLVLPAWRSLAPDTRPRTVACFRSAAFAAPPARGFALAPHDYPRPARATRDPADAARLRDAVFRSVLARRAPPARRRLVYVHRARVRAFSPHAAARLERTLQDGARAAAFEYSRLDVDGLPVSSVLAALGDAGVVVGVHGTTLLATLFLAKGAGVVEILPYRFVNDLYSRPPGSEVRYAAHTLLDGDEYPALIDFGNVQECQSMSPRCRAWYRSDSRQLRFGAADERSISKLLASATANVIAHQRE